MKLYYRNIFITFILCSWFLTSVAFNSLAFEPARANTNPTLPPSKVAHIQAISQLPLVECYEELNEIASLLDDAYLSRAVFLSFNTRKEQAIAYALIRLESPTFYYDRKNPVRNFSHDVAKKIFAVFPNEALSNILTAYGTADTQTKVNIINALGNVEDNSSLSIRHLLLDALNNKTSYIIEGAEYMGPPMRVCDYAYNQLVYRYRIRNVLRSIGSFYDVTTRDHQIKALKDIL